MAAVSLEVANSTLTHVDLTGLGIGLEAAEVRTAARGEGVGQGSTLGLEVDVSAPGSLSDTWGRFEQ